MYAYILPNEQGRITIGKYLRQCLFTLMLRLLPPRQRSEGKENNSISLFQHYHHVSTTDDRHVFHVKTFPKYNRCFHNTIFHQMKKKKHRKKLYSLLVASTNTHISSPPVKDLAVVIVLVVVRSTAIAVAATHQKKWAMKNRHRDFSSSSKSRQHTFFYFFRFFTPQTAHKAINWVTEADFPHTAHYVSHSG